MVSERKFRFLGRNRRRRGKKKKIGKVIRGGKRGEDGHTKDPPFADGSAILRRVSPFE